MKELLVTFMLSCVPSSNTYYKHLINNSKDETLKQLCSLSLFFSFNLFDFQVPQTQRRLTVLAFYSFKQDAVSSFHLIPFTGCHSPFLIQRFFFSFASLWQKMEKSNAIHLEVLFDAEDRIQEMCDLKKF